jgi:hypothetical protein
MRRETQFTHAIQTSIAFLILAGTIFWLATTAFQSLGLDDVKIISGEILSQASESKLLCERILSGTGHQSFYRTQILLLQDQLQKTIEQLSTTSIQPDFQSTAAKIRHLAEQTNFHLWELSANLNNGAEVQKLLIQFEGYAKEMTGIDQQLKQKQK